MRALIVLGAFVTAIAFAEPARADEPPKPTTQWYGWQTLMADGAALLIVGAALPAHDQLGPRAQTGFLLTAGGIYLTGAPVVHLAHGRPGMAAASLGTRVVVPPLLIGGGVLAAYAGGLLLFSDSGGAGVLGATGLFIVGGALALSGVVLPPALDATVFAREPVSPSKASLLRVVPQLDANGRSAGVALTGTVF